MHHLTTPFLVALACASCLLAACSPPTDASCQIERRGARSQVVRVSGQCAGQDFTGVDLSAADVSQVDWTGATCPDGTAASAQGDTCLGHLRPTTANPDMEEGPSTDLPEDVPEDVRGDLPEDVSEDVIEDSQGDVPQPDALDPPDMPQGPVDMDPEPDLEPDLGPDLTQDASEEPDLVDLGPYEPGEVVCEPPMACFGRCVLLQREGMPFSTVSVELPGDTGWTIDMWVFAESFPSLGLPTLLVLDWTQRPAEESLWILVNGVDVDEERLGRLVMQTGVGVTRPVWRSDEPVLPERRWRHLEFNSRRQMFLDGVPVPARWKNEALTFSPRDISGEATLYLAHRPEEATDTWRGVLREVRISRGILHEGPFIPYAVRAGDERLLHWWSLGEGEGNDPWDAVGDADLELNNATWGSCPRSQ